VKALKKPRLIKPATVNRSVVELLQTVLLFGIEKRKYIFPDKPDFAKAKLTEVVKPDRQITHDQQIALEEAMEDREDYAVAYDFASLTGLRRKVVAHLEWSQVDWGQNVIRTVGKGGKQHITPVVGHIEAILRACKGHHPTRVFTFESVKGGRNPRSAASSSRRWPIPTSP
jgi:integrase